MLLSLFSFLFWLWKVKLQLHYCVCILILVSFGMKCGMPVHSKDSCLFSLFVCLYFSIFWVHFFRRRLIAITAQCDRASSHQWRHSRKSSRITSPSSDPCEPQSVGAALLCSTATLCSDSKNTHNKAKLLARWAAAVATAAGTAADSCNQITCKHRHMSLARRLRCRLMTHNCCVARTCFAFGSEALSRVQDGRRFLIVET